MLEELARLTLAVALMGVAFRLPSAWVLRRWRQLSLLLIAGMPGMWLIASACAWLLLGLPLLQAMLLGAIITPTDPVLAGTIVDGKLANDALDADLRHLISAESGANDGLAFLLVMLPVLLLDLSPPQAWHDWLIDILLGKVLCSTLGGIAAGWLVARLLIRLKRAGFGHHGTLLGVTLALALGLLGAAKALHGEGILAVFAAGLAMNYLLRHETSGAEEFFAREHDSIRQFFETPLFLMFGMVLPVGDWLATGNALLLFAAAVLLLRRLPVLFVLAHFVDILSHRAATLFAGWFGPIGVAAIVYAAWADVHEGYERLWTIASLVIFLSVLVHGVTATPLTRLYERHAPQS